MGLRNYKSVPVGELVKYEANSRTHSDEQIAKIVRSINEFGFTNPLLIDENNGIIAGHGRLAAALQAGIDELPCIVLEGLTPDQKAALVIADNKIALDAGWDREILLSQFDFLKQFDYDLTLTGFDVEELCDFMPDELPEAFCGEDECPDVPDEPVTKLGDVWLLGEHRLMCGDSTAINHVDILMNGNKADMVFTDPPYGIGMDGQKESKSKNPKHNRKKHDFRGWDSERPSSEIFNYLVSLNIPLAISGGNYFADLLPPSRGWIYWDKGQDGLTMSDGELIWTNMDKPLRSVKVNRATLKGSVHPTQKPLEVVIFCIEYLGANKSILDLFGGSGSTLIACEKLGRKCFMMELSPEYCDVIIKRYENYSGKKAVREAKDGQEHTEIRQDSAACTD